MSTPIATLVWVIHSKYLDFTVQPNNLVIEEIKLHVHRAMCDFLSLQNALGSHSRIDLRMELLIYRAAVHLVPNFACETWLLKVDRTKWLQKF